MEKRWNQFEKGTSDCYTDMITKSGDIELWNETFEVLLDIIKQEREEDPEYAKELYELETRARITIMMWKAGWKTIWTSWEPADTWKS